MVIIPPDIHLKGDNLEEKQKQSKNTSTRNTGLDAQNFRTERILDTLSNPNSSFSEVRRKLFCTEYPQ